MSKGHKRSLTSIFSLL